ncbi:hypothetical protein EON65_56415, partial [archaeon]
MNLEILSPIVIPDEDGPHGAPSFMFSVSSLSPSQFSDVTQCSTLNHPFTDPRIRSFDTSSVSQTGDMCSNGTSPVLVNVDAVLTPHLDTSPL